MSGAGKGSHALIVGAGGVLGQALAREFSAAGYRVSALRRAVDADAGALAQDVVTRACDFGSSADVRAAVAGLAAERGAVNVLVCNTAHLVVAPMLALAAQDFEDSLRIGVGVAFDAVQAVLPDMLQQGRGSILFSGATASLRGSARFAALAAAKFALRGMAQALAREVQPQGVHVAHVVLDGLLRGSPSVQRFAGDEARSIDPAEAARVYRWLAEQPPSGWTHEIDLRPRSERF